METLLGLRCSIAGFPFDLHLAIDYCPSFVSFGAVYPGKWRYRQVGCRASVTSRSDELIGQFDSNVVDVIAIGSRKEAFIDFCLNSSFGTSSGVRFWTMNTRDSSKVQLSQRGSEKDALQRTLEFPLLLKSPMATILVASAGVDREHIPAIAFLNAVRSAGGLAVAVLLRPFSFEGQRRQQEVDDLLKSIQESSIFYSVMETEILLKTEVETLAEALKSSHNAVLLTVCAVSALASEVSQKLLVSPSEQIMEISTSQIVELVKSYRELKAGFGSGYNIESSMTNAALRCPLLAGGLKDINGTVILTLSCAREIERNEVSEFAAAFRQITGFLGEIIFSGIKEPTLDPNLVITTLFILGCNEATFPPRGSFLSSLASHFRFFSSIILKEPNIAASAATSKSVVADDCDLLLDESNEELQINTSSGFSSSSVNSSMELKIESPSSVSREFDEDESGQEELMSSSVGPGFNMAQLWAKERASLSGKRQTNPKLKDFSMSIGVKSSGNDSMVPESLSRMDVGALDRVSREPSRMDMEMTRKRGALSARAKSMLETERESEKTWTPVIQMQFRGGTYKGRHQGGLPEGKGRLTFEDGSFYDGTWRSGRRCGLGTFCFSNGDVFQGSWRDDVMHGKGWFYFHTGDRWFANFWRGRANGEGRFYSSNGSIFFGNFRNGWRHGDGLFIDSQGLRWTERWEDGVLAERVRAD
ncbi:GTP binding protein [Wolffia australiana]